MSSSRDLANQANRLNPPATLTANKTLVPGDSGSHLFFNSASTITLTFPDTLPLGFNLRVSNAGTGVVLFNKGTRLSYGNAGRDALIFQWDVCDIVLGTDGGNQIFLQTYNLALPILYGQNTALQSRNSTALTSMGFSVPLEPYAAYDIDLCATFTTPITTNTIRLGLAAIANAKWQLEGRVFNTNAGGTSTAWHKSMTTAAEVLAGATTSAGVVNIPLIARITGRVILGANGGDLVPTMGSLAATGAVVVAAGDATMSASKVFDLLRT